MAVVCHISAPPSAVDIAQIARLHANHLPPSRPPLKKHQVSTGGSTTHPAFFFEFASVGDASFRLVSIFLTDGDLSCHVDLVRPAKSVRLSASPKTIAISRRAPAAKNCQSEAGQCGHAICCQVDPHHLRPSDGARAFSFRLDFASAQTPSDRRLGNSEASVYSLLNAAPQ